jgi:hypothetical protein
MDEKLPLLLFPTANHVAPDPGKRFQSNTPHLPQHGRQVNRLTPQIASLQNNFNRYKASISGALAGFEPEADIRNKLIIAKTYSSIAKF